MINYVIKKETKTKKIVYLSEHIHGYNFIPRNDKPNELKIDEIIIVNSNLTDYVLTIKFKKRYKRLLLIVLSILNGADATEGDVQLVLDEIAKMRSILLHKYNQFLKEEKEAIFLEQLRALENNLRLKWQTKSISKPVLSELQSKSHSR